MEATLHEQPAGDDHQERRILHLVAYHPRRTTQPVQHVDQSWLDLRAGRRCPDGWEDDRTGISRLGTSPSTSKWWMATRG